MTIRLTTTRAAFALVLALVYIGLSPARPAAADREHQQLMADLRMLQEQTQQLQALMNGLGEALKAVTLASRTRRRSSEKHLRTAKSRWTRSRRPPRRS